MKTNPFKGEYRAKSQYKQYAALPEGEKAGNPGNRRDEVRAALEKRAALPARRGCAPGPPGSSQTPKACPFSGIFCIKGRRPEQKIRKRNG
jgi:hypothetical protein